MRRLLFEATLWPVLSVDHHATHVDFEGLEALYTAYTRSTMNALTASYFKSLWPLVLKETIYDAEVEFGLGFCVYPTPQALTPAPPLHKLTDWAAFQR